VKEEGYAYHASDLDWTTGVDRRRGADVSDQLVLVVRRLPVGFADSVLELRDGGDVEFTLPRDLNLNEMTRLFGLHRMNTNHFDL
jgi:hypothetical protein